MSFYLRSLNLEIIQEAVLEVVIDLPALVKLTLCPHLPRTTPQNAIMSEAGSMAILSGFLQQAEEYRGRSGRYRGRLRGPELLGPVKYHCSDKLWSVYRTIIRHNSSES